MLVSLYDAVSKHEDISPADVSADATDDAATCDQSDLILVKVSDIPSDLAEDVFRMVFENKRYGGGSIKAMKFCRSDNCAVIQFESSTGNTCALSHMHTHTILIAI